MPKFELEHRYAVFKFSDIEKLNIAEESKSSVFEMLKLVSETFLEGGAPERNVLVLEQDWPEYQLALKALEERVSAEVHE